MRSPDSSTVVVFLHTSFDAGNIAFWHLFKDWEPPFYAVAMDTPGDLTVGPSSSTPCTNTTQSSPCAGTMMDIPYYCDAGLEAHAAWYDRKVRVPVRSLARSLARNATYIRSTWASHLPHTTHAASLVHGAG